MTAQQHLKGPAIPRGDMGLGMCAACLNELAQAVAAAQQDGKQGDALNLPHPEFAITLSPEAMPLPLPDGRFTVGLVALPSCFRHFSGSGNAAPGGGAAPLLLAPPGVKVPRVPGG